MNGYICKCGNEKDFFIECNKIHRGLYCGVCGKWIKWITKDEERVINHKKEKTNDTF